MASKKLSYLDQLLRLHPDDLKQGHWVQEEARAEKLANLIRMVYVLSWIGTTGLSIGIQPFCANVTNLGVGGIWLLFALSYQLFLTRHPYHPAFKYLSTTVDILINTAILYGYHYDMGWSTTLKAIPFMTYFFVLIMASLRFRFELAIFGGLLTIGVYSALSFYIFQTQPIEMGSMVDEFLTAKVNPIQQFYRIMYLVTLTALLLILVYNTRRFVKLRIDEAVKGLLEKQQHEKTQNLFERYFSAKIARYLATHPPELGGKSQTVTILMADLRGFTALSEMLGPTGSVNMLNRIFDQLVEIIFKYDGTLDKFLGDGMLVVFGIPEPQADDADRALAAAREMVKAVSAIGMAKDLSMGIAINSGEVIFGNIGSKQRMEFTVIGDTVNTAARMEAMNKEFGTEIIISESTMRFISDKTRFRELPNVQLRGKKGVVKLFGLDEPPIA